MRLPFLLAAVLLAHTATSTANAALTLDVYNADKNSFSVNSTVIYGETEALVVDTGFTRADALRIAAKVADSGKELKTIFISQADPDYYFGAEVLHQLYPDARVITTPAVKAIIEKKLEKKLSFWGPKLGFNAPVSPIIPEAYRQDTLILDGHVIEIRGTEGVLAHRPYLWIPDNRAILGNVAVFGNLHLWMADTQTEESLQAWSSQLEQMLALQPTVVVPGHMKAGTALDADSIHHSKVYLKRFSQEKKASTNSADLIRKMSSAYRGGGKSIALEIGAKVHMGEMKW